MPTTVQASVPGILGNARLTGAAVAEGRAQDRQCPRCGSGAVRGWGRSGARRRFMCRACGRTFSSTTCTPWAYSKYPDKWAGMWRCMVLGTSVRQTAARLEINPCTSFRWRHRLLAALLGEKPHPVLNGIVEITESFYPDCRKGQRGLGLSNQTRQPEQFNLYFREGWICIVFARDRRHQKIAGVTGLGAPSVDALGEVLGRCIAPESVLCSFKRIWYRRFCQQAGLAHREVRVADQFEMVCGASHKPISPTASIHTYNITAALAYRDGFRRWLSRFQGVASKYLPRYLAWFDLVDRLGSSSGHGYVGDPTATAADSGSGLLEA